MAGQENHDLERRQWEQSLDTVRKIWQLTEEIWDNRSDELGWRLYHESFDGETRETITPERVRDAYIAHEEKTFAESSFDISQGIARMRATYDEWNRIRQDPQQYETYLKCLNKGRFQEFR